MGVRSWRIQQGGRNHDRVCLSGWKVESSVGLKLVWGPWLERESRYMAIGLEGDWIGYQAYQIRWDGDNIACHPTRGQPRVEDPPLVSLRWVASSTLI
jgi:hypothetical protein